MSNYYVEVKKAVLEAIRDNYTTEEWRGNREGLEEMLNDELWDDDAVTGNGSGSYYFSNYRAMEQVTCEMETVTEALMEFCCEPETVGKHFIEEDWDWFDVTARCYVLGSAINEALDELEAEGAFDIIEEEEEAENAENLVAAVAKSFTDTMENIISSASNNEALRPAEA